MLITIKFALFSFPDYAEKCMEYLSAKHLNIRFSLEKEKDGFFPFFGINILRNNGKFATTVY